MRQRRDPVLPPPRLAEVIPVSRLNWPPLGLFSVAPDQRPFAVGVLLGELGNCSLARCKPATILERMKRPGWRPKMTAQSANWVLQRPPVGLANRDKPTAGIDDRKGLLQQLRLLRVLEFPILRTED